MTGDYPVELQRRIHALRREHPEVELDVELASVDDDVAVVKATLRRPGGGSVSSLGAVAGQIRPGTIEQAEQRAIERVLAIAFPPPPVSEAPRSAEPTPITGRQPHAPTSNPAPSQPPQPTERPKPAPIRTNAPIDIGSGAGSGGAAPNRPAPTRPHPVDSGDPPMADFSWTAFWNWAKENGFTKKDDIEAAIGRTYQDLTPAEVRKLILDKRGN